MGTIRRTLTASTLVALLLAGCGGDPGPDPTATPSPDATATDDPEPTPDQTDQTDAADAADPAPVPPIASINPELDWQWAEDLARMEAFPALADAAFDAGNAEGMRFLAATSWPDGFTADALLACLTSEPTPTYAELDAIGHRFRFAFDPVSPAPGFIYPPTGEYPAADGLRIYLGRRIVTTEEDGEVVRTSDNIGRMAIRPDGTVVMFPTCFEYLPGELLDHRVTDGDVGGYTDAEAEGDIRVLFSNSPRNAQDAVCAYLDDGVLDAADLDDLSYMLMPPDIEFSDASIPPDVLERTVTDLCLARLD
jgi:hypothetical protein